MLVGASQGYHRRSWTRLVVRRRGSRARSLELGFALALGMSFAIAVYLRFSSGLFTISDRPEFGPYAGFAAVSMAVWAGLASRLWLSATIVDEGDSGLWPLRFGLANSGALTIVSAGAFFWRGYSFSRATVLLAWLIFSIAGALLALAARRWASKRFDPRAQDTEPQSEESFEHARSFDYEVTKRGFDVVGAALLLVASAPLLAVWYLWAALTSAGPVLIRQERIGRMGKRFELLKLRTLPPETLATSDRDWSVPAASNAMSFVRRIGLDELPQLWNVLRGEMSLVGPRPERPYFVQRFTQQLPGYPSRHQLHAGLTGLAQVRGLRGDSSIAERLEYDLHYLRQWSLGLDAWILLMTVWTVARDLIAAGHLGERALE